MTAVSESQTFLPGIAYARDTDTFSVAPEAVVSRPISLCIHVSRRCNLSCSYCLSSSGPTMRRGLGRLPALVPRLEPWLPLRLVWSGGEPLLESSELIPLAEDLHAKGCIQVLTTNGTIRPASALLDVIDWFDISFHGTDADSYQLTTTRDVYARVLRTVESLLERGVKVSGSAVLTRQSLLELPAFVSRLYEIGVRRFRISRLLPLGRGADVSDVDVPDHSAKSIALTLQRRCPDLTLISPAVRKRAALLTGYFSLENDGTLSSPPELAGVHITECDQHPGWRLALRDHVFLFNGGTD